MMGAFGGLGGLGMLIPGLLWIGLIVLAIWGVSALVRRPQTETERPSALDVLKQRYARGEIGRPEFEEKKSQLS